MSILVLILISILSFVLAWLVALFGEWKVAEVKELSTLPFQKFADLETWMRYIRRGRYATDRVMRSGLDIVSATARKSFVFFFPKSKRVFKNIDPMTGLEKGPSSYFLLEISHKMKKVSSRRMKKNVQE